MIFRFYSFKFLTNRIFATTGLVSILLLLFSCDRRVSNREVYFPIDSLLKAQIYYLAGAKASVNKVALLDDQESKTSFTPSDTSGWKKELSIFDHLNAINKPVNRGYYDVTDNVKDTRSNLKIKLFEAKRDSADKYIKLPVQYLKVYYYKTIDNVRKIESKYTEKDAMYSGTRYMVMEFNEINNKPVLSYYSVYGGQKMFLGDSVRYMVNASVSYN